MKIVTAAIIKKDNKVLLARRNQYQKLAGLWEFPGGKLENGESIQKCIERELNEEFEISSKAGKILTESIYTYEHGSIKLIAIEVEIKNDKFKLKVHDDIQWVEIKNLLNYDLAPADIPIAKYLQGEINV